MKQPKINWYKIAESEKELSFSDNNLAVIVTNGKKMTLAKTNDMYYACGYACPHAGGHLAEGHIDTQGNIVCPLHNYRFSLENGRNISGEGYFLKTYAVELREDGVYIGIEEKKLFGFL